MAKSKRVPKYRHHKATGQAVVTLDGKECYLGKYGTSNSHKRYTNKIAEWQHSLTQAPSLVTVAQLSMLFMAWAEGHYIKHGEPTSEVSLIRYSLKRLNRVASEKQATEITPRIVKQIRDSMIQDGLARSTINGTISRIRRAVKWGVAEELVPESVLVSLQALSDLKKGRTAAKEPEPVKPVPIAHVNALEGHVKPQVWAMIQLQLLTGMRPGEVRIIRACDIEMSGDVWLYTPKRHKTEHHNQSRIVAIGPKGQGVIQEWLTTSITAYVFGTSLGTPYRKDSYRNAILRGCEKAFDMPQHLRKISKKAKNRELLLKQASEWRQKNCWQPNQLRHNFATIARRTGGLEAAQVTLGHSTMKTSEIYAERDIAKAVEIIAKIG